MTLELSPLLMGLIAYMALVQTATFVVLCTINTQVGQARSEVDIERWRKFVEDQQRQEDKDWESRTSE